MEDKEGNSKIEKEILAYHHFHSRDYNKETKESNNLPEDNNFEKNHIDDFIEKT